MTQRPQISVIIPYFNAGRLVDEAIDSVRRQACAPYEIILVNDGSTDDITRRVTALGRDIVFLEQENKGPAAARNLGIAQASGEIIAFLDSDDLWPDGKLDAQLARLRQNPALGIVTGRVRVAKLEGGDDWQETFPEVETKLFVHLGAALIRRRVFDDIGLLDETLLLNEDLDWFLRARERMVPMAVMAETTLIVRRHAGNLTRGKTVYDGGLLKILKRSVERRRRLYGKANNLPPLSGDGQR